MYFSLYLHVPTILKTYSWNNNNHICPPRFPPQNGKRNPVPILNEADLFYLGGLVRWQKINKQANVFIYVSTQGLQIRRDRSPNMPSLLSPFSVDSSPPGDWANRIRSSYPRDVRIPMFWLKKLVR